MTISFAGPASGDFYRQLDQEYTSTIERLLPEQSDSASAAAGKPQE
jgi:hypothetical protein